MELRGEISRCIKFKEKARTWGSNELGNGRRKFWEIGNTDKHKFQSIGRAKLYIWDGVFGIRFTVYKRE